MAAFPLQFFAKEKKSFLNSVLSSVLMSLSLMAFPMTTCVTVKFNAKPVSWSSHCIFENWFPVATDRGPLTYSKHEPKRLLLKAFVKYNCNLLEPLQASSKMIALKYCYTQQWKHWTMWKLCHEKTVENIFIIIFMGNLLFGVGLC